MEFKLLETYTCNLKFSYMGMIVLFLCASYCWNYQENQQEGCTYCSNISLVLNWYNWLYARL
jgi:hypothetical protein